MRSEALLEETARGLRSRPRELPSVWLYDARGSELYEEVTRLPEYYLPRREEQILHARSGEIAALIPARTLVELGAGAANNVRLLLDALTSLERFVPFDVSEEAVRANSRQVAADYPNLSVEPIAADFERDLDLLPKGDRTLVAMLGSTIGNLSPERRSRLLSQVDDALLLGLDLVKDTARLDAAYSDPRGVTEAFVRNALTALNRELAATFDQARFAYEARWDGEEEWMEIGLRALEAHLVAVPALGLEVAFVRDEFLRVEISAKFSRERVEREAREAGLAVEAWWTDGAGDFALALMT